MSPRRGDPPRVDRSHVFCCVNLPPEGDREGWLMPMPQEKPRGGRREVA